MTDDTAPSFYWFDYETFGTHPAWDRPCQFAGIRTDMDLNIIGEPTMLYCKQAPDYLPHPQACRVTGLSPQVVNREGVCEAEFISRILDEIARPQTCSVGYNSIRFDDEFTRHTSFRNFRDPYEYEWKDGNSRWDLLDVVRLTRALRPDGIKWPLNEKGSASNKLEHLCIANGIAHEDAHDALSDVMATIGVAQLIKSACPRLFKYAFDNKDKQSVSKLLNTGERRPCIQISGMISSQRHHAGIILPLTQHPDNRNSIIVLDLHENPEQLLSLGAEEISEKLYLSGEKAASSSSSRPGLRTIQINKCPVLVPLNTLREADAKRLDIDSVLIEQHRQLAQGLFTEERLSTIKAAMSREWPVANEDVDGSLYTGGFLSANDRRLALELQQLEPARIASHGEHFEDKRLTELAWRYQARNYPDSLDSEKKLRWRDHCLQRLNAEVSEWLNFGTFVQAIADCDWHSDEEQLKRDLLDYAKSLKSDLSVGATVAQEAARE